MKYISTEGLQKLKDELKDRKTTQRQEVAQRLEEAKSLGDLSENMEYQAAKEAQAFNEGRIFKLEELIKTAVIIKPSKKRYVQVQIGATVTIQMVGKKSQNQSFIIVGSQEADPLEGKISNESPLGVAFLGHKTGDIVEVQTPRGKMKYKIIGIK